MAATTNPTPSPLGDHKHLNPSELGTKEYWDALYARELTNHTSSVAAGDETVDEGTIWFDESNAEATVIRELDALAEDGQLSKESSSFLDLGTGNGHMLLALRYPDEDDEDSDADEDGEGEGDGDGEEESAGKGWQGEVVGVDYSAASVDLARRIAGQRHDRHASTSTSANKKSTDQPSPIRFETWDLLTEPPSPTWLPQNASGTFDVVLDKGTFDAISLMPTHTQAGHGVPHPCATYRSNVVPLISPGGFLVLTSCNWTRDELVEWLVPNDGDEEDVLEVFREARYPSFTFGGKRGQSVVSVIFQRGARRET